LIGYLVAGTFLDVAYFSLLYAFVALAVVMRRELDESASEKQASEMLREQTRQASVSGPRFPDFVPSPAKRGY
jgi:hypothetical protein